MFIRVRANVQCMSVSPSCPHISVCPRRDNCKQFSQICNSMFLRLLLGRFGCFCIALVVLLPDDLMRRCVCVYVCVLPYDVRSTDSVISVSLLCTHTHSCTCTCILYFVKLFCCTLFRSERLWTSAAVGTVNSRNNDQIYHIHRFVLH